MNELLNLSSAFGLSGAAGLNAYIPLLTLGIMQRTGTVHLSSPYSTLGEWWCIAILGVLLAVELVVDKIPGADHINDVVHTFIRPTAGAIVFAAQAGHVSWIHPGVWVAIGLLTSGSMHATKAIARPVVNVGTAGLGAPVISTVENAFSVTLSILAILFPILALALLIFFAWLIYKFLRKLFRARSAATQMEITATQVRVQAPSEENWGGGV
jgi:hypothetical protein